MNPISSETLVRSVDQLVTNIERIVIGKGPAVRLLVMALLAEGHVLIEDVPGVAKTVLAKSLAKSLGVKFQRVQCTPDLLPSDVTGVSVFNAKLNEFELRRGPVFANLLLVDELNRATPRTQSALLECLAERQVTVEGESIPVPHPFLVIATQNPLDFEGTFPLPEAQIDRFSVRMQVGYPTEDNEIEILKSRKTNDPLESLSQVWEPEGILSAQALVKEVAVDEKVVRYIVQLVGATRRHRSVAMAASPRASLALYRLAQADAAMNGQKYVTPERVKALFSSVVEHRITVKSEARLQSQTSTHVAAEILSRIAMPSVV